MRLPSFLVDLQMSKIIMHVTTSIVPEIIVVASANLILLNGTIKLLYVQPYINPTAKTVNM